MKAAAPLAAVVVVIVVAVAVGLGLAETSTVLLTLALVTVVFPIASRLRTEHDPWIWWVAPAAFVAKLIGAGIRYWVLVGAYEGVGDAVRYHNNGLFLAETWRSLRVPSVGVGTGAGTVFVDSVTGLVYAVHQPTLLGGFFIFATLAFVGQLLFYAAFRRSVPDGRLDVYACLVLFLPGLVFWPSSIGKESLMIFFLGIAAYGLSRAFVAYKPLWLVLAAAGLWGAGMIRPHVAAVLAASFAGAALFGRGRWLGGAAVRRVVVLGIAAAFVWTSITALEDRFAIQTAEDVDPFVAEIQRRTQQGGSAVEGGAIASPIDLPAAAVRVLFRPLPLEAHNLQAMASALENLMVLGIVVWRLPWMMRRLRLLRTPYLALSAAFTFGFVIVFSTIFNLGILARQRAQVLPFFLAVLVALGWDTRRVPEKLDTHGPRVPLSEPPPLYAGRHLMPTGDT